MHIKIASKVLRFTVFFHIVKMNYSISIYACTDFPSSRNAGNHKMFGHLLAHYISKNLHSERRLLGYIRKTFRFSVNDEIFTMRCKIDYVLLHILKFAISMNILATCCSRIFQFCVKLFSLSLSRAECYVQRSIHQAYNQMMNNGMLFSCLPFLFVLKFQLNYPEKVHCLNLIYNS